MPPSALVDACLTLETVLDASRPFYLFSGAPSHPRARAPTHTLDDAVLLPPLLGDVVDDFARHGGFTAVARALGDPSALPLHACGALLAALGGVTPQLKPAFGAPACAAVAAAACAGLASRVREALQGEAGLERGHVYALLGHVRQTLRDARDTGRGAARARRSGGGASGRRRRGGGGGEEGGEGEGEGDGDAADDAKVEEVATALAVRCTQTRRIHLRLVGLSILSDVLQSSSGGSGGGGGAGGGSRRRRRDRRDARGVGAVGARCRRWPPRRTCTSKESSPPSSTPPPRTRRS